MSDLIDRQAAIDAFDLPIYNIKGKENAEKVVEYLKAVLQRIKDLPSAQPSVSDCLGCNCPKMERLKEQKTFSEMVHLHDDETHDKRTETHGLLAVASAQPEIIRCKECRFYKKEFGFNCIEYTVCSLSPSHYPIRRDDDFCSRAERKEE